MSLTPEEVETLREDRKESPRSLSPEIDLLSFHEQRAGRLVLDPEYVAIQSVYPADLYSSA